MSWDSVAWDRQGLPWFRITAIAAALAVAWFIAANTMWTEEDQPFWAWLTFLALFLTTLVSLLVGLVAKFVLSRN